VDNKVLPSLPVWVAPTEQMVLLAMDCDWSEKVAKLPKAIIIINAMFFMEIDFNFKKFK
jgi:hypothetical protein